MKIKNYFFVGLLLLGLCSCSENTKNEDTPDINPGGNSEAKQEYFARKHLAMDFTGTWCGWCPRLLEIMENLEKNDLFSTVAVHCKDDLSNAEWETVQNHFEVKGYPCMGLNGKIIDSGNETIVDDCEEETSNIGINATISTKGDKSYVVADVYSKKEIFEQLNLVVWSIKDGLIADQANYLAGKAGYQYSKFFKESNPIEGYEHNHVFKDFLSPVLGEEIPIEEFGEKKYFSSMYSFKKESDLKILVFVMNEETKEVYNSRIFNLK